jgi:Protein kinase domain
MRDGVAAEPRGQGQVPPARSQSGRKLRMGFVLDVAGYGARTAPLQNEVQRRLPLLVAITLAECGMSLDDVSHQWTGDGINAVLPADIDPTVVLPVLIRSLAASLGVDNARSDDRIRMRMAIGVGVVEQSAAGFGGPLVVDINRLVDSAPLRSALSVYPTADLVVAISDQVHATVIRPGYPGIPGAQFRQVNVVAKEFSGPAWIWVSARQWSEPAYLPLAPGDLREIGGYRIAACLGTGAAARVYLGVSRDGDWAAVKAFRAEFADDPDIRRRLTVGARAASVPHGPHIVHVIDADTEAGQPWAASMLVRGPSLAAAVAQTGPLPAASAAWLALGLARACAALHEESLAHQAITPSNVLLEPDGPVLSDFGLSRQALTGGAGSAADDVLLLGSTAFFAVTGRSPWGGGPAILAGEAPGEPDLTGCPHILAPIVAACLDPAPGRRPTAAELITQLTAAAGPRPRLWLPEAVAARFPEYGEFPEPAPAHRLRFRSLRSLFVPGRPPRSTP